MGADNLLYGGAIADFPDSMAAEIEAAYNQVLAENGRPALPAEDAQDRRMLFIAISRGVINHLQKKQTAISVTLPPNPAGAVVAAAVGKREA